jgi:site-specific DNA recombinase
MSIYGYVRVSTAEQAADDKTSLTTQRRVIEQKAEIHGEPVAQFFEDAGVTGAQELAKRPAGAALMAAVGRGDMVIVSRLDRGFRNAEDALTVSRQLRERGAHLIIADMGDDPVTGNGTARMFFGMLALVAEFERERMRERVNDGKAGKLARGGHAGGKRPFGYRVVGSGRDARREPLPEEQEAIAYAREARAAGESLRSIAAFLTDSGTPVSHVTLSRALARVKQKGG